MGSGPWGIISVATASPSTPKDAPIESSRRATDSESSQTELDDLRDLREALGRLEGESLVAQDRVPFLVDFVGVHEGLDDLVVGDPEGPGGRWGADRKQRVPHLLPVPAVEVHHHDRPDAALLPVQPGFLRDPVERVGELVLAPGRWAGGPGDRHRDAARHEGFAHEPGALLEAGLDGRRVLDHESRGELAEGGRIRGEVLVPKVSREGPVLPRREVRDDVAAPGGEEPERGLCDDARVHDHRYRRLGPDAHLLDYLLDRRPRGHAAVVARGGRHADEWHAGIEGSAFRHVDGTASADPDGELEVPFADPFLAVPYLFPGGVGDQLFLL